MLAKHQ